MTSKPENSVQLLRHFMVDLETTSKSADASIVSIAAVPFSPEAGIVSDPPDCLYLRVHWSSGAQPGRYVDSATMKWWQGLGGLPLAELRSPSRVLLKEALQRLRAFLSSRGTVEPVSPPIVWAAPVSFDLPILSHAYAQESSSARHWPPYWTEASPWERGNERDVRTILEAVRFVRGDAAADVLAQQSKDAAGDKAHHALYDAIAQADVVVAAVLALKEAPQ